MIFVLGWMDKERMSEWPREVYVKRPDGFFHKPPSLLIYDSRHAHFADTVTTQVKQAIFVLAIIPGGLKELPPLNIDVNRSFNCEPHEKVGGQKANTHSQRQLGNVG